MRVAYMQSSSRLVPSHLGVTACLIVLGWVLVRQSLTRGTSSVKTKQVCAWGRTDLELISNVRMETAHLRIVTQTSNLSAAALTEVMRCE